MAVVDDSSDVGEATAPGRRRVFSAPRVFTAALCVGVLLGAVAVVADNVPLAAARVLLILASSGLSWGLAAILVGALAHRARAAAVGGGLAVVTAVLSYYGVIALSGTRPSAGADDLLREAGIWLLLALSAGPVAGAAGWFARHGGLWSRPLAWGSLGGLLASQGVYALVSYAWARFDLTLWSVGLPLTLILLPAVTVALGTRRTRPGLALAALLGVAVIGTGGWFVLYRLISSSYQ